MSRVQKTEQNILLSNVPLTTRISVKIPSNEISSSPENAASAHLGHKLVGDVLVATGVTFCVAPFLTIVDKAIVQSAAGSHTMMRSGFESIQGMVRNPVGYFKSPTFLLMWGVYAATYSTANSLKTFAEHQEYKQERSSSNPSKPSQGLEKVGIFLGTTVVNSGTSLMKDKSYARMFGTNSVSAVMPRMTYALWMSRDLTVVGSSFILPDLVSGRLADAYGLDQKTAKSISQLTLPVVAQFIAGPLHYMGLDLFNRNLSTKTWSEAIIDRSQSLGRGFAPVVTARIARIAPGYGIGGVFNTQLRDNWREYVIQRQMKAMTVTQDSQKQTASKLVALLLGKKIAWQGTEWSCLLDYRSNIFTRKMTQIEID